MKTKLIIGICTVICISAAAVYGQEYKIQIPNSSESKLFLRNFPDDLPVTGYNGTEIIITATDGDFTPPERSKGLRPVYPGGDDNSGMGLNVNKDGNNIQVTCIVPITRHPEYQVKVPENISVKIESGCEKSSNITIENVKGEIDIQNCHGITLKNIAGPLVLSTISGDIEAGFAPGRISKPVSINSVAGEIDITIPAQTSAILEISTIAGTFYSNFDFDQTKDGLKKIGGNNISYELNGGGPKFSIATVSGNIYLRKGN